jgi:hypothetical protein
MGVDALIAWDFDEVSGNALDISGNNYTGTVHGSLARSTDTRLKHGTSLKITADGATQWVDKTFSPALNYSAPNKNFTVSAWLKISPDTSSVQDQAIALIQGSSNISFSYNESSDNIRVEEDTGNIFYALQSVEKNDWIHFAFTYNQDASPSNCDLYINGKRATLSSGTCLSTFNPGTISRFSVGEEQEGGSGSTQVKGRKDSLIDDVRLYNNTFIAAEIKELYLAGLADHQDLAQR